MPEAARDVERIETLARALASAFPDAAKRFHACQASLESKEQYIRWQRERANSKADRERDEAELSRLAKAVEASLRACEQGAELQGELARLTARNLPAVFKRCDLIRRPNDFGVNRHYFDHAFDWRRYAKQCRDIEAEAAIVLERDPAQHAPAERNNMAASAAENAGDAGHEEMGPGATRWAGLGDILLHFRIPQDKYDAVDGRLKRFRLRNAGNSKAIMEHDAPGRNQPRFLYNLSMIAPLVQDLAVAPAPAPDAAPDKRPTENSSPPV